MKTTTPDWLTSTAPCATVDPELFCPSDWPTSTRSLEGRDLLAVARSICAGCPFVVECVKDGADDHHLIRGGLTHKERHPKCADSGIQPAGAAIGRQVQSDRAKDREIQARRLAAQNYTRAEIAHKLGVSERTVAKTYLQRVAS